MNAPPSTAIAAPRYPVHLVAGPWGAGKSSLINALLALRPAGERWVVLLNEAGRTEVGSAVTPTALPVTIKDIVGACACCTGQVVFVSALAGLIRQTKPHRVFVEVGSSAVLSDLVNAVQQSFRDAVSLETVISVFNVASGSRVDSSAPSIRDQWNNADTLVVHGSEPNDAVELVETLKSASSEKRVIAGWPDAGTLVTLLQSPRHARSA